MIIFRPNCSFPNTEPTGFIYSPNIRSTLDIVWSCVSIIILSTWSVLHLTVPPDIEAVDPSEKIRKQIFFLLRKLSWMGIMLIFPEYLLAIGAANQLIASVNTEALREKFVGKDKDNVPWSRTHTIQADMGGIALRFSEQSNRKIRDPKPQNPHTSSNLTSYEGPIDASKERDQQLESIRFLQDFDKKQKRYLSGLGKSQWESFGQHWTLAANYIRHAEELTIINANNVASLQGKVWILDSKQLALAREYKIIKRLPHIEKRDIQDRSKSDGLVRTLAVIQVIWLVVQIIARRIVHVSSSALEFSTLAFSSCAFIIYLIEWGKPKDVSVPIYIDTDAAVTPNAFKAIAEAAPIIFMRNRHYYMPQSSVHQAIDDKTYDNIYIARRIICTSVLTTTLFGGIHLFAWNLDFPTPVERLLWRTAALLVAIVPTICALIVLGETMVCKSTHRTSKKIVFIFGPFYISSRLYLIVESFRALYFLPPETFIATWAINGPHIG
ncbi:hypothetical protein K432DRAFT_307903 [Lepidopterella palustris CBS 459.81]|uniref:Uncharacterized protein n=1 Tax=Lepidopterella palustris CBS 459.81 TaxID=1314670 RepID=A0A8E2E1K6_9PEZI|nr:hypothetical protein K432DRAFT_307903 [Lepidopterella palustris CBS 459.81]